MENKKELTAEEAYNKTKALLESYEKGDCLGGNPMCWIEKYASQEVSRALEKQKAEIEILNNANVEQEQIISELEKEVEVLKTSKVNEYAMAQINRVNEVNKTLREALADSIELANVPLNEIDSTHYDRWQKIKSPLSSTSHNSKEETLKK